MSCGAVDPSVPTVVGVPVEDVSTDEMVRGVPMLSHRFGLVRQAATSAMGPANDSWAAQACRFILNAAFGIVLPAYALWLYAKHGEAPCETPVGPWLHTFAVVGFLMGGLGLWVNLRMLAIAPTMRYAANLESNEERARALAPALGTLSATGCVSCCCIAPLGVFALYWWIKGNFDVWGTFPRDEYAAAPWQRSLPRGLGRAHALATRPHRRQPRRLCASC